MDGGGFIRGP